MKRLCLLFAALTAGCAAFAQFAVGSTTITFNDPTRSGGFGSGGGPGRQIQTEIYYPATAAGTNVAVADGEFPVITFGHGFLMVWSAYQNIWQEFVARGYIMAFPRTEGGTFPNHQNFALDLALVNDRMLELNDNPASIFFNKLDGTSALMGYSMGGGCATVAAANNPNITALATLALAETNVSAIGAAANVTVPAVVLSGTSDGVTPPSEHHIPIYNALASDCKHRVNIIGGAHCYFNNSNFNCDTGEFFASSGISVSRAQQQQITYDYLNAWLDAVLKGSCDGWTAFNELIDDDPRTTVNADCASGLDPNPCPCPGDFNNDGVIDTADLLVFLGNYGCAGECLGDFTGDGITGTGDLLIFLSVFGTLCP